MGEEGEESEENGFLFAWKRNVKKVHFGEENEFFLYINF